MLSKKICFVVFLAVCALANPAQSKDQNAAPLQPYQEVFMTPEGETARAVEAKPEHGNLFAGILVALFISAIVLSVAGRSYREYAKTLEKEIAKLESEIKALVRQNIRVDSSLFQRALEKHKILKNAVDKIESA